MFLLGVIASKSVLNFRYKKIFIQVPCTKKYLVDLLKTRFGGSVYDKYYKSSRTTYTCYELKAREDLLRLLSIMEEYQVDIPEDFMSMLSGIA